MTGSRRVTLSSAIIGGGLTAWLTLSPALATWGSAKAGSDYQGTVALEEAFGDPRLWGVLSLVLALSQTLSGKGNVEYQTGYQGSLMLKKAFSDPSLSPSFAYFVLAVETPLLDSAAGQELSLNTGCRAFLGQYNEIDMRELTLKYSAEHYSLQFGFQQVAWGETFGVFVADLVNPKDLRDLLLTDAEWVRRSVAAFNGQLFFGALRAQAVFTPIPGIDILPEPNSAFDVISGRFGLIYERPERFALKRFGRDVEGGGRVSYLIAEKLDLAAIYYYHWNRNSVFAIQNRTEGTILTPFRKRIQSFGLTWSYTLDAWVLRGDTVMHLDEPTQSLGPVPPGSATHLLSVVGADYTTSHPWTFGFQLHYDRLGSSNTYWISGRALFSFFNDHLKPELFIFRGIGNEDMWIQPKLGYNFLDGLMTLSLRGDLVWGDKDLRNGTMGLLREKSRLLLWLSATF